jgi:hypothetical protein
MLVRKSIFAIMSILLLATTTAQASGDPARGNELQGECSDCHGEDGMGDEDYPRLAGLDEDYLFEQLNLIKKGESSEEAEMMLSNHPAAGRSGRVKNTRELVINGVPFIVIYRELKTLQRIEILRVLQVA